MGVRASVLIVMLSASAAAADTTTADLDELEKVEPSGYWALSFSGGAAFPVKAYADTHEQALGASASLGYTAKSGLGIRVLAVYSPLPVSDDVPADDPDLDPDGDNHVVHAAVAPRFTLGKETLRLFIGAGGGVLFETAAATRTAAAALAQAGLELHILGGAGLTLGGSYVQSFARENKARLASAQAGFVMTF